MSLISLMYGLQAAIAISFSVASEPTPSVPASIADLEAAVLAKYSSDQSPAPILASHHYEKNQQSPAVPGDLAKLEAAVLAKYSTEVPNVPSAPSSLNVRRIDDQPEVPADVAKLEADVLAKYSAQTPDVPNAQKAEASPEMPADVAKLEAAVLAKYSTATPDVPNTQSTEVQKEENLQQKIERLEKENEQLQKIKKLEQENAQLRQEGSDPAVAKTEDSVAKTEPPTDIAKLEAAVLAKYSTETPDVPNTQSGLNVRRAESAEPAAETSKPEVPADVAKLEAAVLAKYSTETPDVPNAQSGLNVRRSEETPHLSEQSAASPEVPADVAKLEAAVLAKYSAETPDVPNSEQVKAEQSPARFTLKKPTPDAAPEENAAAAADSPTPDATPDAAPAADSVTQDKVDVLEKVQPEEKKKTSVIHDMPHYRNHGSAMYHVETATRKSLTPEQQAAAREREEKAAKKREELAKKQEEVENIFHVTKHYNQNAPNATSEKQSGWFLTCCRTIFYLAVMVSVGAVAYQKYEVIYQIANNGKKNLKSFKAKDEDFSAQLDGFSAPPRYSHGVSSPPRFGSPKQSMERAFSSVSESVTSAVHGGRRGLSRRGGADAMDSAEFGV